MKSDSNDITNATIYSSPSLYVDNFAGLCAAKNTNECVKYLNDDFKNLHVWGHENQQKFAVQKFKIINLKLNKKFGSMKTLENKVIFGNDKPPWQKKVVYLWLLVDDRLNFKAYMKHNYKNVLQSTWRISKLRKTTSTGTLLRIFKTWILPFMIMGHKFGSFNVSMIYLLFPK